MSSLSAKAAAMIQQGSEVPSDRPWRSASGLWYNLPATSLGMTGQQPCRVAAGETRMEQPTSDSSPTGISKGRLEMLFDGIFAIAMTILVLELKVPELADRHSVAELAQALGHHAATFVSYVLSFVVLGIMWFRHNQQYRHLRHITRGMLALQLLQLAMAAFFPFCAALFGRYPTNRLSVVLYVGCVMVYAGGGLLEWLVAEKAGSMAPQLGLDELRRLRRRTVRRTVALTAMFLCTLLLALSR
jgi:uncharacterized membrane protein